MPFYTPPKEEQFNIDFERYTPIDVMAYWDEHGNITPIKFKYVNPDESVETIKIDSIKYRKNIRNGFQYCCVTTWYGRQKLFNLIFHIEQHIWVIENQKI